jgi:hypothetical protein
VLDRDDLELRPELNALAKLTSGCTAEVPKA